VLAGLLVVACCLHTTDTIQYTLHHFLKKNTVNKTNHPVLVCYMATVQPSVRLIGSISIYTEAYDLPKLYVELHSI